MWEGATKKDPPSAVGTNFLVVISSGKNNSQHTHAHSEVHSHTHTQWEAGEQRKGGSCENTASQYQKRLERKYGAIFLTAPRLSELVK